MSPPAVPSIDKLLNKDTPGGSRGQTESGAVCGTGRRAAIVYLMGRRTPSRPEGRTARAVWFLEPGRVALREEPLRPAPGQVLVRSRLIGISHGTERLAFRGLLPPDLEADPALPPWRARCATR